MSNTNGEVMIPEVDSVLEKCVINANKLFACRECGKHFKTHAYLKQHILASHVSTIKLLGSIANS